MEWFANIEVGFPTQLTTKPIAATLMLISLLNFLIEV